MGLTDNLFVNFGLTTLSLLNGILLLWLGLTVILNAQSRSWGLWLAGFGLVLGGVFFFLHTTIINVFNDLFWIDNMVWWPLAWGMVILLPLAWYVDILWYTGYWNLKTGEHPNLDRAKNIQRLSILILAGMLALMAVVLFLSEPFQQFLHGQRLHLNFVLSSVHVHVFFWIYALFIAQCMILSIYALRFPVPSGRLMGDEARSRARPYFMGASISLFLVTFVVILIFFWLESQLRMDYHIEQSIASAANFDLVVNALILASVLLIGQAICSYEVYTGETIPRKGLLHHWERVILLGVTVSLFTAFAMVFQIRNIYIVLFISIFMVTFFAIMTWQMFTEREHFMEQLRPFVNSQQLYRQGLALEQQNIMQKMNRDGMEDTLETIFTHLCREILDTSYALLVADYTFLSIRDFMIGFPDEDALVSVNMIQVWQATLNQKDDLITAFHPEEKSVIHWAISLWNEIGRIGTLFLGEKTNRTLYTHEEIEIARAACERLLDTKASTEMTRQLLSLQREQITDSQILDQRARQVLHDEVLPDMQALMIELSNPKVAFDEKLQIMDGLQGLHKRLSELLYVLPAPYAPEITHDRLLDVIKKFPEISEKKVFSEVHWVVDDEAVQQFEKLPVQIREIVFFAVREAIRNAARYGGRSIPETVNHTLEIGISTGACLEIAVKDSGGVDVTRIMNGAEGGTGKGLSIHQTMLAIIGSTLLVESVPGQFTKVTIRLPLLK